MHIRIIAFIAILFSSITTQAQTEWENSFGLPDSSFALDMIQVQDGDFVLYGGTNAFTENSNAFLLKFKENGDSVWLKDLGFTVHPYEGTLIEASNGDLIVCGEKIMRCNNFGNEIWSLDQASVDIDEAANGELFSVNYDKVYKLDAGGNILDEEIVGLPLGEFQDSVNLLGIVFVNIPFESYSQLECVNDSLISIGGTRISESTFSQEYSWDSSILLFDQNLLSESNFTKLIFPSLNILNYDFEPFNLYSNFVTSSLVVSSLWINEEQNDPRICYSQNSPNTALQENLEVSLLNNGIFEVGFSIACLPSADTGCDTIPALRTIYKSEDEYYSNGFVNSYGGQNCGLDQYITSSGLYFEIDHETNNCYYSAPIFIGEIGKIDYMPVVVKGEDNNVFISGTMDLEIEGVNFFASDWEYSSSTQFTIAKLNNVFLNDCNISGFADQPINVFEEQTATNTRLKWNHYSGRTDGCILRGGPINGNDVTSPFLQIPGNLLVQGDNVEGDAEGYDFSGAFGSNAQFTLFNATTYPNGPTADLIPGGFYKWKVRCGCLVNPDLPLSQRFLGSNVVLSPWSEWDVFQNLD